MNIEISKNESNAISIVRILAMLSIVICHFFQAYDNYLAYRFNIGVQVFFVLSGYLYGHKFINNWFSWFLGRFKKLYIPCFIYCLVASTILIAITNESFSIKHYVTISALNGIDHLWFMKAIFLCYLTTPLLQFFRKWPLHIYIVLIVFGAVEFGYFRIHIDLFSWVWLYAIGYYFPLLNNICKKTISLIFVSFSIAISLKMTLGFDGRLIVELWHYITGAALCLLLIPFLTKFVDVKNNDWIKSIDQYSFYIYITHHIYLIGPLSFVLFIPNKIVLILVVILLIIISTYLLKKVSDNIIKLI